MVMAAACGFAIGSATSGLIASYVIPLFGWRALFIIGGGIPLSVVLGLFFWLPYFDPVSRRQAGQQFRACPYWKINPQVSLPKDVSFVLADEQVKVRGVSHLFQGGNASITPVIWCMFFFQLLVLNFLNSWWPSISRSAGFALPQALQGRHVLSVRRHPGHHRAGCPGRPIWLLQNTGHCLCGGAIAVALMPLALFSASVSVAAFSAAGFFVIGNAQLLNAFAASIYPTPVRSTGTSWALGVGRLARLRRVLCSAAY